MGRNAYTYRHGYRGPTSERMARFTDRKARYRCWEWIGSKATSGYGHIRIDGRLRSAHRVAYEMVNGPIPDGMVVMHSCDNPSCVNPQHLSLGTKKVNSDDKFAKGRARFVSGTDHSLSKLTPDLIEEARRLRSEGESYTAIGWRFGLHRSTIARALKGRTWRFSVHP